MDLKELRSAPGAPPDDNTDRDDDCVLANGGRKQVLDCDITDSMVEQTEATAELDNDAAPTAYNWDKPAEPPAQTISFKQLFIRNWHPTVVYCGVFWSFGMCVAFLGPTLLDLGCQTATDLKQISWVFFCQLVTTLIGSVLAGFLVQR